MGRLWNSSTDHHGIPTSSFNCVILKEILKFSEPQFPNKQMWILIIHVFKNKHYLSVFALDFASRTCLGISLNGDTGPGALPLVYYSVAEKSTHLAMLRYRNIVTNSGRKGEASVVGSHYWSDDNCIWNFTVQVCDGYFRRWVTLN